MNSGIRFSVALIVVIMVLLGFYYASLDDSGGEGGDGSSTPAITVDSSSEPRSVEPRRVESVTEAVVSEPDPIVAEVVEEDAPTSGIVEFDEYPTADPSDAVASEPDVSDDAIVTSAVATDAEDVSETSETTEADTSDDDAALTDTVDASEDADEAETEPGSTVADEVRRPSSSADATTIVRRVQAAGVGIHRVATIERDQSLANAAMRAISGASEAGLVEGPRGSVWVPLPQGVDSELLAGALVERAGSDDTPHVLVLTGEGDAVDFAGRVQSTEVSGSDASGGWSVRFRLTAKDADAVRTATRALVGATVAWIADGRILAVDRQLIPISGRGNVPARFASETSADAVAGFLKDGSSSASRGGSPSLALKTTSTSNIVVGAGSLPPDQYTDYVVKPGDTFESIAAAWFGDRNKHSLIAIANPYKESSRLTIGEILRLPPKTTEQTIDIPVTGASDGPAVYTVRSGDTLGKIAQAAYGKASLWTRIYEANRAVIGENPANLKVGMQLEIPR
jgi:nucleoid-associated protein YgaU